MNYTRVPLILSNRNMSDFKEPEQSDNFFQQYEPYSYSYTKLAPDDGINFYAVPLYKVYELKWYEKYKRLERLKKEDSCSAHKLKCAEYSANQEIKRHDEAKEKYKPMPSGACNFTRVVHTTLQIPPATKP